MIRRHNINDYGVKNKNKLVIGDFHVTQVSLSITQVKKKPFPLNKLSQEIEIS